MFLKNDSVFLKKKKMFGENPAFRAKNPFETPVKTDTRYIGKHPTSTRAPLESVSGFTQHTHKCITKTRLVQEYTQKIIKTLEREIKVSCKHIFHQNIYHDVTTLGSLR